MEMMPASSNEFPVAWSTIRTPDGTGMAIVKLSRAPVE
jgi:hypothetical protein